MAGNVVTEVPILQVIEVAPEQAEIHETIATIVIETGPVGPPGPPGASAAGSFYQHDQITPQTQWVIQHNLGMRPNITVEDSAGTEHYPDLVYDTLNQVTLTFVSAMAGSAYLS